MSILKKSIKILLLFSLTAMACFCIAACGLGKDNSKIYIIPEEEFKSCVKTDENGGIEKLDRKKLEKADLESLITDEKYYAVLYADGKKVSQGWFSFFNDVTVNEEEIYIGTKKDIEIESDVGYPQKSNPTISEIPYAQISVDPSGNKKSDYYIAVEFAANVAEGEKFHVKFQFYEGSSNRDVEAFKDIMYKKQITAEPSVKYLSYEDFMSGSYDEKLKDSIEARIDEKFYAVIDYRLSAFKNIEETDTATVSISASSESIGDLKLRIEEFPTADYTENGTSATASFKLRDGGEEGRIYRFIISLMAESGGNIKISAEISGNKKSVLGKKTVTSTATVNAALTVESKLEFTLINGTYYTVTGLGQEEGEIIKVPSKYNDKPVKAIGDNVFSSYSHIKEVILPDTLENIGVGAFKGCTSIESIIIPSSVTVIGNNAFAGCTDMNIYCDSAEKPTGWSESWSDSDAYVMWDYNNRFTLNSDKKSYSFSYKGINGINVAIPAMYNELSVTEITDAAFSDATDLRKVKIPESVTLICDSVFDNCTKLLDINVSENNKNYKSVDGNLYTKDGSVLIKYAVGKTNDTFTALSSVTKISNGAFAGCSSLTSISLNVFTIGKGAFKNCTGLKSLKTGYRTESIGDEAFSGCTGLTKVYMNGLDNGSIGVGAFSGCTELVSVKLGNVSIINERVFYGCTKLEKIFIPITVTEICEGAFGECNGVNIDYQGQGSAWDRLEKHTGWNTYYFDGEYKTISYTVKCNQGADYYES